MARGGNRLGRNLTRRDRSRFHGIPYEAFRHRCESRAIRPFVNMRTSLFRARCRPRPSSLTPRIIGIPKRFEDQTVRSARERESRPPASRRSSSRSSPRASRVHAHARGLGRRRRAERGLKNRVEKAVLLKDAGVPLFPNDFTRNADVPPSCASTAVDEAALAALEITLRIAGRIMACALSARRPSFIEDAASCCRFSSRRPTWRRGLRRLPQARHGRHRGRLGQLFAPRPES